MRRLLLLAGIWGWSFLFIKVAVEGLTPTAVAAARITLGTVTMLAVLRARRLALPRDPAAWRAFAFMGLIHSAVPFTLLAWGQERITSALAAVLNAATPFFAALFAALTLAERLERSQLAGLVIGFAGVAVAAGLGGSDVASSSATGSLAALGAAACFGLGFAYARRRLGGTPPLVAATGQLVAATVLALPFGVVTTAVSGASMNGRRLLAVALLGVLGTGVAYVLNYQSIADLGPTRASVVTQLVPVVAVTVGVLFLDEPFRLRLVGGAALAIAGIRLLHGRRGRLDPVLEPGTGAPPPLE